MQEKEEAKTISLANYQSGEFEISERNEIEKVVLDKTYYINEDNMTIKENNKNIGETYKIWANVSNSSIKDKINSILSDYDSRTKLIDAIVNTSMKNGINGISIEFENIEDKDSMRRFVIELTPRLREIGINTAIVLNNNITKEDYKNIVDYVIE